MQKKCSNVGCTAPKGLCAESVSPEYQQCPHWKEGKGEDFDSKTKRSNRNINNIPWSGLELQPDGIGLISHRSSPVIIGTIGGANAGKTSYLGMLYMLLFNGKRFNNWNFVGSYTLIAWERLAKYLKIKSNGKVDFPEPTPSNPDFYSLYHLALRNENHLYDILFADSSGEVFTQWANDVNDPNAENARWIYENSAAIIFFIDCEAIIKGKGRARQSIVQLASQVAANLGDRPIVIVWSKADQIAEVRSNIKESIEDALNQFFPNATSIQISNFSKQDPDTLCHENNFKVMEEILDKLSTPKQLKLIPDVGDTSDFFFKYRGSYGN